MNYKNFTFKTGRVYDYEQEIQVIVKGKKVYFQDKQRYCFAKYDIDQDLVDWFIEDNEFAISFLKTDVIQRYDNARFEHLGGLETKEIFG